MKKYIVLCVTFFCLTATAQCIKTIQAGANYYIYLKTDGTLWGWGSNQFGVFANNTFTSRTQPAQIGTANNWKEVSVQTQVLALRTDGTLWAWGNNAAGQLGTGAPLNYIHHMVQVGTATDWKTIFAGGNYSMAIKNDGSLWIWGEGSFNVCADGVPAGHTTPVRLGTANDWQSIGGGTDTAFAIKIDGSLWGWGRNMEWQLGIGNNLSVTGPTRIVPGTTWLKVASGVYNTAAIRSDGTLWSWGANSYGEVGENPQIPRTIPSQIATGSDWTEIEVGSLNGFALKSNGSLWAWGRNDMGQFGNGLTDHGWIPTQIGTATDWTAVASDYTVSIATKDDGSLWTTGMAQELNGGGSLSYVPQSVSCVLADNEFAASRPFGIYPNPVNDNLNLLNPDSREITAVAIVNSLGQTVRKIYNSATEIRVADLQSGVYLLQVYTSEGMAAQKFIKR